MTEAQFVPLEQHNALTAGPAPWTDTRVPAQVWHVARAVYGTESHTDEQRLYRTLQAALLTTPAPLTEAARDVLAERLRQIKAEGWTPEHDDEHVCGELRKAAACYSLFNTKPTPTLWPRQWDESWWRPGEDDRRNLVKAAALLLAEIERLDRAKR